MNKKVTISIITVILVAIVTVGAYFLLSNKSNEEVKEPSEQIRVEPTNKDNEDTKSGKSLVVYFSVPETDDPNKKMTTEEENSAIVVDGKVLEIPNM